MVYNTLVFKRKKTKRNKSLGKLTVSLLFVISSCVILQSSAKNENVVNLGGNNLRNTVKISGGKVSLPEDSECWYGNNCLATVIPAGGKDIYHGRILLQNLIRTNKRSDYRSNEIFANFRNIRFGAIGKNILYRSSSPVNNILDRAAYSDELARKNKIKTIVNLSDDETLIEKYISSDGFSSFYYKSLYEQGNVVALNLGGNYSAEDFHKGIAKGLRFIIEKEGPYLFHCIEGKDRAGFLAALLECLMGASYEEIRDDFMRSYINYYHVVPGTDKYDAILQSHFIPTMLQITGLKEEADLTKVNLSAMASRELKRYGLSSEEINMLKSELSETAD